MIFLLLGLFFGVLAYIFSLSLGVGISGALVGTAIAVFMMPTVAWGFFGILAFGAAAILYGLWVAPFFRGRNGPSRKIVRAQHLAGYSLIALAFVVPLVTTWAAFGHADTYQQLLAVSEDEFEAEDVLLDQTNARFVDQELAERSGNELLGNVRGLGSQVNIGRPVIQRVDDELKWVAGFEHNSFFRWLANREVPGFVTVSSSHYGDSEIVTDQSITIGPGEYGFSFGDNLMRHLYRNGYANVGLMDPTLELDEDGHPHWVVTRISPRQGFGGHMVDGVVVVDAETREIADYSVDDAPDWITQIQPHTLVRSRLNDWGRFVQGWWNQVIANEGVIEPTDEMLLVYTADGEAMWYTGLRSRGTDQQGTMGFALIDARSGEATYYPRTGITEEAAAAAIEGQVQEAGYKASTPIPYNVTGLPTFIAVLKDEYGNPQKIGMVAYDDRSTAATGAGLDTTMRRYQTAISESQGDLLVEEGVEAETIEGEVVRTRLETVDDATTLYFMVDAVEDTAFRVSTTGSAEALLTESGDEVRFEVMNTEPSEVTAQAFENLSFELAPEEPAPEMEEELPGQDGDEAPMDDEASGEANDENQE